MNKMSAFRCPVCTVWVMEGFQVPPFYCSDTCRDTSKYFGCSLDENKEQYKTQVTHKELSGDHKDYLRAFIKSVRWKYSETNSRIPHAYTLLEWHMNQQTKFMALAHAIWGYGYDKVPFGRRVYRYLDIDEYRYWSLDWPITETDLINRARLDGKGPSDGYDLNVKPMTE